MIRIVDVEKLGIPVVDISNLPSVQGSLANSGNDSGPAALAFRISPQLNGNLRVDPEIHLPSPGMDVDIAHYYNSNATLTSGSIFGIGGTLSTNKLAQAAGTPLLVTMTRGDGGVATWQHDGSGSFGPSNFTTNTQQNLNTIQKDTTVPLAPLWLETTPDGKITAYPANTTGMKTSVTYEQDAVGNRHTYSYASGLLDHLEDAVGRRVTFAYASGRLDSIQDWADRRTTYQYDTSIPARPVLATIIGPSGCQTGYGYDTGARLTRITDPNGYDTTYAYDIVSRVTQKTVAGGGTTQYEFDSTYVKITNPDGSIVTNTLDSNWNVNGVVNPLGVANTGTYNPQGLLTSVQNYYGAIATVTYDSSNMVVGTTDPLGHITTVQRDVYHNATTLIRADGSVTQSIFGYAGSPFDTTGAKRRLQVTVDPLGNRTSYTYEGRGQLLSLQNALGAFTTYGYDNFGNCTNKTDALGNITTWAYDLAGNPIGATNALGNTATTTYDPQNRPLTIMDPLGYVTSMGYDSMGHLLVRVDALGNRTSYSYNVFGSVLTAQNALGFVSTNTYDVENRLTEQINALGFVSTISYDAVGRRKAYIDALGNRTTTLYDAISQPVATVNALGYATTTTYDLAGRAIASIDPLGFATSTVYDLVNRPIASIDALGRYSTTIYDAAGRPQNSIDALGNISTTLYDAVGRPLARINALGYANTMVYDAAGRRIASVNALGYSTSYGYDAVGQTVRTQDARGAVSSSVYDARGQLVLSIPVNANPTTYTYDALGRPILVNQAMYNSRSLITSYAYDAIGRMTASVLATGYRTSYAYDAVGQAVAKQDALGQRTTSIYDAVGRTVVQQDALGFRTTLVYDAVGHQTVVCDAVGNRTSMQYDTRGMLKSTQQPWGAFTTNTYNPIGDLTLRIDGRGYATTSTYDLLDRISTSQAMNGALTTHSYDAAGRKTALWNESVLTTTSYDAVGQVQLMTEQSSGSAVAYSLSYQYDSVGNRTLMTDGEGRRTTYLYGTPSSLYAEITGPYETQKTGYRFDSTGGLYERQMSFFSAADEIHLRNVNGWETSINYTQPSGAQNLFAANYDANGNRISMVENSNNAHSTYTYFGYDPTYQLINEQRADVPGYANTYTYDGTGNRLTQNALGIRTTYQYGAGNRLLSEQTGAAFTTYSYDQNGNLALINAANALTTYSWNTDNRLIKVDNSDGSSEQMSYGADGLRRKKSVTPAGGPTSDTIFVYDGQNLLQERNGSGLILVNYTWGPEQWNIYTGRNWAAGSIGNSVLLQRRASTPGDLAGVISSYFGSDQSSNTRLLFDSSGAVTDRMTYEAFGELFARTGTVITPFLFGGSVGYFTDALRRLQAKFRDLDPTTAKWLSIDPIGFWGGDPNLSNYVQNNPIRWIDPSGLASVPPPKLPPAPPPIIRPSPYPIGEPYPFPRPGRPIEIPGAGPRIPTDAPLPVKGPVIEGPILRWAPKLIRFCEVAGAVVSMIGILDLFAEPAGGPGDEAPRKRGRCKEFHPDLPDYISTPGFGNFGLNSGTAANDAKLDGAGYLGLIPSELMLVPDNYVFYCATGGAAQHYSVYMGNKKKFGIICCQTCYDDGPFYNIVWQCKANVDSR